MVTTIRPELSERNRYWISKHRHYELKHFCLQYPIWKKEYEALKIPKLSLAVIEIVAKTNTPSDPTLNYVLKKAYYKERIDLIEKVAMETDEYLYEYILKAVTEGISYTQLKSRLKIPCSRDMYYDRYRRFFWLLSEARK